MTPEERQMLTDFANKIAQTPSPVHDTEAEEFIRTHIGNRPDALYLLTQTVLIQNMAIEHAQQEIQQLKQQAPTNPAPAAGGGGFLGHGGGWATPGTPQPVTPQPPPPPAPQPSYYQPPQQQVPAAPVVPQSGMGSFLRSAGTTAAGIAAGALAFEGIRSMFGGVEHLFGFGNQPRFGGSGFLGGGFGGGGPVEETVVNNYYDRPGGQEERVADNLGPDDNVNYADTNVEDPSDDTSVDDTSSFDDSSSSNDDLV
jgi:hypothetical protein